MSAKNVSNYGAGKKGERKFPAIFPKDIPPRYSLIFISAAFLLLASALSGVGFSLNTPVYWITGTVVWIMWFAIMFLIINPRTDIWLNSSRRRLRTTAKVIFAVVFIAGILELGVMLFFSYGYVASGADNQFSTVLSELQSAFRYNDGTALNQQATENLLDGKNPYAEANIVETFIKFNGHYDRLTPLRVGELADVFPYPTHEQMKRLWEEAVENPAQPPAELESHVCYPAGAFVLPAPFIAAGLKDIRLIYFILAIGGLAYAIWRIPHKKRWIFIGLAVISVEIWNTLACGESGTIIFPFLLIAWLTIGRNSWISAIFMGIAVATKQTAWFFLPFYLIFLWRASNTRDAGLALGIISLIFIAFNGYYIAADPGLWLRSVTSPVTDQLFPVGVGIITPVTSGLVNIQSSLPFSILEIIVFAGGIIWYAFNCKKYPAAGPILAVLPLFFAWRSLWTYFFYVTIIIFAMMLMRDEGENTTNGVNSKL
jgi:uncharacterized membrane protein